MKKMENQERKEGKDKKGCRLHSRQEARNPWFPFRPISAAFIWAFASQEDLRSETKSRAYEGKRFQLKRHVHYG